MKTRFLDLLLDGYRKDVPLYVCIFLPLILFTGFAYSLGAGIALSIMVAVAATLTNISIAWMEWRINNGKQ